MFFESAQWNIFEVHVHVGGTHPYVSPAAGSARALVTEYTQGLPFLPPKVFSFHNFFLGKNCSCLARWWCTATFSCGSFSGFWAIDLWGVGPYTRQFEPPHPVQSFGSKELLGIFKLPQVLELNVFCFPVISRVQIWLSLGDGVAFASPHPSDMIKDAERSMIESGCYRFD